MVILKFYYNMMNLHLSDDFNCLKPQTSISCTRYPIRNPLCNAYLLNMNMHAIERQIAFLSQINLITRYLKKTTTHSLYGYKVHEKIGFLHYINKHVTQ